MGLSHPCSCAYIIHTPKKLSNGCTVFYKWYIPPEPTRNGSALLTLPRTYLIFTVKRRWVSRVPFPLHFSIISSASQRDIVHGDKWEQSARVQTVRGRSLPSPDPLLPAPAALRRCIQHCRRVLADNHNCVLKPLIKFCSLEWYCFVMNPHEKYLRLGAYGCGGVSRGGTYCVFTFPMDAKWIPAITSFLQPRKKIYRHKYQIVPILQILFGSV